MNKIKLACLLSVLAVGSVQAATPCNGFEVKFKNQLADDLVIRKVQLNGAEITPNHMEKLDAKTEQVFVVNKSQENIAMNGEFIFNTISLPVKEVVVKFDLKNGALACDHIDSPQASDYAVESTRRLGKGVDYTISNK